MKDGEESYKNTILGYNMVSVAVASWRSSSQLKSSGDVVHEVPTDVMLKCP